MMIFIYYFYTYYVMIIYISFRAVGGKREYSNNSEVGEGHASVRNGRFCDDGEKR
jgi:hypothetical protein